MDLIELAYFAPTEWYLCRHTFEWTHARTGLNAHDLWLFMEHYDG